MGPWRTISLQARIFFARVNYFLLLGTKSNCIDFTIKFQLIRRQKGVFFNSLCPWLTMANLKSFRREKNLITEEILSSDNGLDFLHHEDLYRVRLPCSNEIDFYRFFIVLKSIFCRFYFSRAWGSKSEFFLQRSLTLNHSFYYHFFQIDSNLIRFKLRIGGRTKSSSFRLYVPFNDSVWMGCCLHFSNNCVLYWIVGLQRNRFLSIFHSIEIDFLSIPLSQSLEPKIRIFPWAVPWIQILFLLSFFFSW